MKLSEEVAIYNDAHDRNGEAHIISTVRLDNWARRIAELEQQLASCKAALRYSVDRRLELEHTIDLQKKTFDDEVALLEQENERLRAALKQIAVAHIGWASQKAREALQEVK